MKQQLNIRKQKQLILSPLVIKKSEDVFKTKPVLKDKNRTEISKKKLGKNNVYL